jgi:hypothetical protein
MLRAQGFPHRGKSVLHVSCLREEAGHCYSDREFQLTDARHRLVVLTGPQWSPHEALP